MRLGIWAPLPHTIAPEPDIERALADLTTPGQGEPLDRSYAFVVDVVRQAEAMGFDITLVAERLVAADLEAWVVSSALAVQTSKIQIMTAAHPGIVNPQVVAKMGASLDRLSGGRFCINIVPGRRSHEFELYGNGGSPCEGEARYRRMDEFIHVMKGLWGREPFTFEGEFYRARDAGMLTTPMRLPAPPVYAATGAQQGMEIVARECDLWFATYEPGIGAYEQNLQRIAGDIADMKSRAARYGRNLGFGVSTHVCCESTDAAAMDYVRELEKVPQHNVAIKSLGVGLAGSPRTIADRIRRYEDMGIGLLMLQFHPMKNGLKRFADQVLPLAGR